MACSQASYDTVRAVICPILPEACAWTNEQVFWYLVNAVRTYVCLTYDEAACGWSGDQVIAFLRSSASCSVVDSNPGPEGWGLAREVILGTTQCPTSAPACFGQVSGGVNPAVVLVGAAALGAVLVAAAATSNGGRRA